MRKERGLSQLELARAAQLSRQSVHAIETGRAIPAVDVALRLARALASSAEVLFSGVSARKSLTTEPVGDSLSGRVALAHIAGRWLSYSMSGADVARCADAVVREAEPGRVTVDALRAPDELLGNVVIMGCAPALGVLADRLNTHAGVGRFLWLPRSSTSGLEALARRQTHVCGVHLVDAGTGEPNVPDARRYTSQRALVLITLARWEAGLVVAAGNPKGIRGVADLAREELRLISREPGSGALRLLERECARAGLPVETITKAAIQASGHLDVARAVSLGVGDVGIATRDAALAFGLAFLPIAEERYDLVVPRDELSEARLARMFDVMTGGPFRRELSSLGYDVRQCGERVAELLVS